MLDVHRVDRSGSSGCSRTASADPSCRNPKDSGEHGSRQTWRRRPSRHKKVLAQVRATTAPTTGSTSARTNRSCARWPTPTATARTGSATFRQLWIIRINAAARLNGMPYSRFIQGLRLAGVEDRSQDAGRSGRAGSRGVRRCRRDRQEAHPGPGIAERATPLRHQRAQPGYQAHQSAPRSPFRTAGGAPFHCRRTTLHQGRSSASSSPIACPCRRAEGNETPPADDVLTVPIRSSRQSPTRRHHKECLRVPHPGSSGSDRSANYCWSRTRSRIPAISAR